MLPELFDTKITDNGADQSNQRIHRREDVPNRKAQRNSLRAVKAREFPQPQVCVEQKDDEANFR
jgi:hypothetical protein